MTLTLYGQPIGKPRMSQRDHWKVRPCVARFRLWADQLRLAARRTTKIRLKAPTRLSVTAYFASTSQHRVGPHGLKPDFDNVLKATTDALFFNDELIYHASITKLWADGGPARVVVSWE